MKKPCSSPRHIGVFLCLTLLFGACSDAIQVDDTDKKFPVKLNATLSGDLVTLHWDEAMVSNFESYKLVRSFTPIPVGLNPSPNGTTIRVLLESDDPETTSFEDGATPIVQKLYYKLYVDIGDRLVESDNVEVTLSNFTIDAIPFFAKFHPDFPWVFIGDQATGDLILVDYLQQQALSRHENVVYPSSIEFTSLAFQQYQGAQEAYFWSGFGTITRYSLPALNVLYSKPNSENGFSMQANGRGQILTTSYDYYSSLTVRDYETLSPIKDHYRSNYYERRTIIMLDSTNERYCEISPYQLRSFNLKQSAGWNIINEQVKNTNSYSSLYLTIPVSRSKQFFIPYNTGEVYNMDLDRVGVLPFTISLDLRGFAFSDDDQYIYAIGSISFPIASVIQKFRMSDFSFVDSKTIDQSNPIAIKAVPGGVVIVGSDNSTGKTFIKKITL